MKLLKALSMFILVVAIGFMTYACSKGKSPVEPVIDTPQEISQDIPDSIGTEGSGRNVLSIYECMIDPNAKTFTVESINRNSEYHFPLTNLYPDILQITDINWTPDFWVDIKLTHPLPGSGIDAFDPRVIAILPAYPGVSMDYPIFNVQANNSIILEPDGYTKLFDWVNPSIVGNTNPFVAYFKDEPNRVWSWNGTTEETKRWQMDLSGFSGTFVFDLVVDVSTNYPNAPQPIIDNAPEPVAISTVIGPGLTSDGGDASIEVTFLDWQGSSDIMCNLESPDLFNDAIQLTYNGPGPNPDEYLFSGTISNELLAPEGEYSVLVATWDIPTEVHVFSEVTAEVNNDFFNLVDVTPPWLNFSPKDAYIDGNYAYVAGGWFGLHIFDISNPLNPIWVNKVDTPDEAHGVCVTGGYAYVADGYSGLQIIDIMPPESAYIINSVNTPYRAERVYVTEGYAYVADFTNQGGLQIIDVEPPESAYIVNFVDTQGQGTDICVIGGYAYVTVDYGGGLKIIDVEPPESAYIVNSVVIPGAAKGVHVIGNYAYVVGSGGGLQIIDVELPESAYIANTVYSSTDATGVYVTGGYAYIVYHTHLGLSGFQIVDVNPPESAYIVKTFDTPPWPERVYVSDGYAYVACDEGGLQIIDVDPPESAGIVESIDTPGLAYGVYVTDGYAYVANGRAGLQIIDVDPTGSAHAVKSVDTSGFVYEAYVTGGYAYVVDSSGLHIIDVDPPESANIVNSVNIGYSYGVHVSGSYAYVANGGAGLQIIDIDPPQSAYIVKSVDTPDDALGVYELDGYAYVAGHYTMYEYSGLQIIDVNPPESASIVVSIDTAYWAERVYVTGSYAYVACDGYYGLQIINGTRIVKSVFTPGYANGVYVIDGYAYVADGYSGLQIIDVNPPESAYIVNSVDTSGSARDVYVTDGYAYVAAKEGGLRIIDLW